MANDKIEIVLEEYRQLWSYYHALLGEWKNLIDWYFKVVTLPAGAVVFLTSAKTETLSISGQVAGALLIVIFLTGFGIYITYSKECGNGYKYEKALSKLRSYLREIPELKLRDVIIIDELRASHPRLSFGGIKAWRGASIAIINSAIGCASLSILLKINSLWLWGKIFIFLLFIHTLVHRYMVARYRRSGGEGN